MGLLSRFRKKSQPSPPEPFTFHDPRQPLLPSPLPLVLAVHQASLANFGWTILTFPQPEPSGPPGNTPPSQSSQGPQLSQLSQLSEIAQGSQPAPSPPLSTHHPLQSAARDLFTASQSFFALPQSSKQNFLNTRFKTEEGWNHVPGEKEFITLRTVEGSPEILREAAQRYWSLMGEYLKNCLGRLEISLGLKEGELKRYVGRCEGMGKGEEERCATLLRLFRYEGAASSPSQEDGDGGVGGGGGEAKVVAEPHADLGLLSVVVGNVAGLEVWDGTDFYAVEKEFGDMEKVGHATVLVGRQLEALSNGRLPAGGHRVVGYPAKDDTVRKGQDGYRYSIVFVLRADEDVEVDTNRLATPITGEFAEPITGVKAGEWYEGIRRRHFNINIGLEEREVQRKRIREMNMKNGVAA